MCAATFVALASGCGLDIGGSNASLDDDGGVVEPIDGAPFDAGHDAANVVDAAPHDGSVPLDAAADGAPPPPLDAGVDGCPTSVENCENGVDDNCDGLVDCADPMCGGYECVAAAPPGWSGYFRTVTGAASATAPACPDGSTATTLYAEPAGAAECTGCGCNVVEGSCAPPSISCVAGSTTCASSSASPAVDWTSAIDNGACDMPANLLGASTSLSCSITRATSVATAGSCTAVQSTFPNTAKFGESVDVCGSAMHGGGCTTGEVCVPKSAAPYSTSVCIQANGAQSCPSGWGTATNVYTGANDTRGCSTCTCNSSATTCTGGSYTFYDLDLCGGDGTNGTSAPVTIATTCTDVTPLLDMDSWSVKATLPTATSTCSNQGGSPTGSLSPMGETTICCQ